MEEKVYCRYAGGHGRRQGHLGKSRVDVTRQSWTMWERRGRERGERGTRRSSPGGQSSKKVRVTKMSVLYREEALGEGQSSPCVGEFRTEGGVCQPSWWLGQLWHIKYISYLCWDLKLNRCPISPGPKRCYLINATRKISLLFFHVSLPGS